MVSLALELWLQLSSLERFWNVFEWWGMLQWSYLCAFDSFYSGKPLGSWCRGAVAVAV